MLLRETNTLRSHLKIIIALTVAIISFAISVEANDQLSDFGEIKRTWSDNSQFFLGESPDWSAPAIASDNWPEFDQQIRQLDYKGIFWYSFDIHIEGTGKPLQDWSYHVHMLAAYEVYWDDVLIGQNGRPAQEKTNEIPGQVWQSFLVPSELMTPGKHTLKLKGSAHYRSTGMKLLREGWLQPYDPSFRYVSFWSLVPSLFVGIAGVIGFYFLTLWFTEGRQPEHLVFFLLLECLTILGYAIQWDHLVGYSYDLEWINLLMERVSGVGAAILLPLYFLIKNNAPKPWLWIIAAALITITVEQFINHNSLGWLVSYSLALFASCWLGIKNSRWLWWESLGLAGCVIAIMSDDFENVFLFFPTLLSLILISHAIAMQHRRRALQEASLIETQLRAELLKKHIQPHFLLNTLTSLMEWVETDTERSTEFIAELADEFRLMSQAAAESIIPLSREILLCQKHLAIMSLRLQKRCHLKTEGIDAKDKIPPAIFHTLIENAFSHNVYDNDDVPFSLSKSENHQLVSFEFKAPLGQKQTSDFRKIGSGTGRRYIEARLSQTFKQHWKLQESNTAEYWLTKIDITAKQYHKTLSEWELKKAGTEENIT